MVSSGGDNALLANQILPDRPKKLSISFLSNVITKCVVLILHRMELSIRSDRATDFSSFSVDLAIFYYLVVIY